MRLPEIDYPAAIVATECPFCLESLMMSSDSIGLLCSCCERPMYACPSRFTKCSNCGGASINDCCCDICGVSLEALTEESSVDAIESLIKAQEEALRECK